MKPDSPQQPPPLPKEEIAQPSHLAYQTPADQLHDRPRPSTAEQAARASWLAPALALALLVLTWKMPRGAGSVVIGVINGALLLAGMCLGAVALAAAVKIGGRNDGRSRRVNLQAGIGVGLSVLILIVMVWNTFFSAPPRRAYATTAPTATGISATPRPLDPIMDYPGWLGTGGESGASFVVLSLPDESAETRQFKSKFPKDFAVLMLKVNTSQSPFDVYVDTSRASARLGDGQLISALPIRDLLNAATTDKEQLIDEWMPPRQCRAHASVEMNMLIPMPPGMTFTNVTSVSITVNGLPLDVKGAYLTPEEKKQRISRGGPAGGGQQTQPPPGPR